MLANYSQVYESHYFLVPVHQEVPNNKLRTLMVPDLASI